MERLMFPKDVKDLTETLASFVTFSCNSGDFILKIPNSLVSNVHLLSYDHLVYLLLL